MGHVPQLSTHPNLYLVKISGWHAPSPMSCAKCFSPILSQTLVVVVQWPKFGHSTTLNNKGYKAHKEMGHVPQLSSHPHLYLVKISGWHTPSPTSCAKCFSPILSHTLIVVVQWPKFGHSTTLNNKGYKAHKEMGHVPQLSSHPNLYLVKISGWHAPSPTSSAKCFSPIFSHTLIVVVKRPKFGHSTTLNNKGYKAQRDGTCPTT